MKHIDLAVQGMSCEHCVARVKKAVTNLSGVQGVEVDLKAGKVSVDFDETQIDDRRIAAAITDTGYDVVA